MITGAGKTYPFLAAKCAQKMSLAVACEDYLQQGESGDGDILLVAIAKELENGSLEEASQTLLQDKYELLLVNLGWDLLSLFIPRFSPSHLYTLQLIHKITQTCSPKEMCLALLEQMELVTSERVFVYFLLLQPLQQVLLRLQRKRTVDSSLNSVRILLHRHYPNVASETEVSPSKTQNIEHRPNDNESDEENMETGQTSDGATAGGEKERAEDSMQVDVSSSTQEMAVHEAASETLDFLQPFLEQLHTEHISKVGGNLSTSDGWSYRQRQCVSMLLCLLDYPLVSHNLSKTSTRESHHQRSRELAERVMSSVVSCHCGAVELLSWRERVGLPSPLADQRDGSGDSDQSPAPLSRLGLSCFAYLLLVEGMNSSYLPSILNPQYLLHINMAHVKALLQRPERRTISKGLSLLDTVVHRIAPHSLPPHTLDDSRHLDTAKLLTNLMVSCQNKKVRQRCVPLLRHLIGCFSRRGRHRVYRNLLRCVTHAGVIGLLVHDIKNEVDQALKLEVLEPDEPFLGAGLMSLLSTVATASKEEDLLQEVDRIMPVLNFLRYLLIRDKPEDNKTGIWEEMVTKDIRERFVIPLREMLVVARAHSKQELELKVEEGKRGRKAEETTQQGKGPELNVQVMGTTLPKISLQDELKMLHLAGHQFDMLDSVLVRVEELLNNRTSNN